MSTLNIKGVAEQGQVAVGTVYKWIHQGLIPAKWVGGGKDSRAHYEFDEADVDKFLETRHVWGKQAEPVKVEDCYPFNLMRAVLDQFGREIDIWDLNVRIFRDYISELSEREQKVLVMRFQDGMTQDEVGAALNVSRERVRQIQARAVRRLMAHVANGYCKTVPKRELTIANARIRELEKQIMLLSGELSDVQMLPKKAEAVLTLDEMGLSVRTYNCLRRAGIDTLDDIIQFDWDQKTKTPIEMEETDYRYPSWMHIRNFGVGCYRELQQKVYEIVGYTIGE